MKTKTINIAPSKSKELLRLQRLNSKFRLLEQTYCSWLHVYYPKLSQDDIISFINSVKYLASNRGIKGTISFIKLQRLAYTKYIAEDIDSIPSVSKTKSGESKGIRRNLSFFKETERREAGILTCLNIIRSFTLNELPDINDIEIKSHINEKFESSIDTEISNFVKLLRFKANPVSMNQSKFNGFITIRNGPNGPSIANIYKDLANVRPDIGENLFKLTEPAYKSAVGSLQRFIKSKEGLITISRYFSTVVENKSTLSSKISVISSPEGKIRTVAISTYGVQAALYSIHKEIFRVLKSIPGDLTFDQSRGLTHMVKESGHSYGSFDLKSATDRFPRSIQRLLLEKIYGKEKADAWDSVISINFYSKDFKREVKGETGQPIGLLSSGAVFTLCHHFIIYLSHKRAKVNPFGNTYVILGDDVVICNDIVAKQYLNIIKDIGVEISEIKTHKSKHSFEIGKRWMHKDEEISPFSIVPLTQAKNGSAIITDCIITESRRNGVIDDISDKVATYIIHYNKMSHDNDIARIKKLATISSGIGNSMHNKHQGHDTVSIIAKLFDIEGNFDPKVADAIVKGICYYQFYTGVGSHGQNNDDIYKSKIEENGGVTQIIRATPHFSILSRIEKSFQDEVWFEPDSLDSELDSAKIVKNLSIATSEVLFSANTQTRRIIRNNRILKSVCDCIKKYHNDAQMGQSEGIPLWLYHKYYSDLVNEPPIGRFGKSIPTFASYIEEASII